MRIVFSFFIVLAALLFNGVAAQAHFAQGAKARTILIARDGDVLTAYVRTPLPLVFSDVVTTAQATTQPLDTPFLRFQPTAIGGRYRLLMDAVGADEARFRERLQNALAWSQNGLDVPARVTGFRIYAQMPTTDFDDPQAAQAAIASASTSFDTDFGQSYVDYALELSAPDAAGTLQVRSAYQPLPLPEEVTVDNHIIDARGEASISYTRSGQLETPATIDGSVWRTVGEFVWQGVVHIIKGLDHVFLVLCLTLGIGAHTRLLWMATAFALGHSVTLVATFLGAVPPWPWFIPAVEIAIAATVLYTAVAALMGRMDSILLIAGIGLLHGLGFSFVLGDILGRDAPDLVPALAAFNVGIEIGQLIIIAVALLAMAVISRISSSVSTGLRTAVLVGIAVISVWWVMERSAVLIA